MEPRRRVRSRAKSSSLTTIKVIHSPQRTLSLEAPADSARFHRKPFISTKIGRLTLLQSRQPEYLSIQRRSDPPVGESGQEPSERRKRKPQGDRTRNSRRIRQGTRKGTVDETSEGPDKKPARESETRPQRGTKKRLARESDTSLTLHPGNWLQRDGTRKLLQRRNDEVRETRARP